MEFSVCERPRGLGRNLCAPCLLVAAGLVMAVIAVRPGHFTGVFVVVPLLGMAVFWGLRGALGGALYAGALTLVVSMREPDYTGHFLAAAGVLLPAATLLGKVLDDLRRLRRQQEALLEFLPDATLAIDTRHRVMLWNRGIEQMTGVAKDDMLGQGDYAYAVPFYGRKRPLLVDIVLGRGGEWEKEYTNLQRKGDLLVGEGYAPCAYGGRGLHFWTMAAPLFDGQGRVVGAVQCVRDIGERKQMEERLRYLSTRDPLTGLYNRRYFEEELERLEKGRSFPVSLLVADVDGLKAVNDTLGHDRGDALLRRVAGILREQFRVSDVVARMGGDEFAVLLPGVDVAAAAAAAARVRRAVAEDNARQGDPVLSLSLGVATAPGPGASLWETYREADDEMYRERGGRNPRGR